MNSYDLSAADPDLRGRAASAMPGSPPRARPASAPRVAALVGATLAAAVFALNGAAIGSRIAAFARPAAPVLVALPDANVPWQVHPAAASRTNRSPADLRTTFAADRPRFQAIARRYQALHRSKEETHIALRLVIQPDGSVSDAGVVATDARDAEFEKAMVDAVRATRFAARPDAGPTAFTWNLVLTAAAAETAVRGRPVADVLGEEDAARMRFDQLHARFFPGPATRGDRYLVATYVVQPDGAVSDATIETSTYYNADFESAFLRELRKARFPARTDVDATGYSLRFGDPGAIAADGDPPPPTRREPARIL